MILYVDKNNDLRKLNNIFFLIHNLSSIIISCEYECVILMRAIYNYYNEVRCIMVFCK